MKAKLKLLLWKLYWKMFPAETVLEDIRSMPEDRLVLLIYRLSAGDELWAEFADRFCKECPCTGTCVINGEEVEWKPCDDSPGACPYGDAVCWWLHRPAGE